MGVPLVREAKFEIVAPDLDVKDALALEKQVEHLDALIQEERMAEADELAGECLSRVIHFPEHRAVLLRKWWVLPLVIGSVVALAVLVLYLVV